MASQTISLRFKRRIHAPPAAVHRAFTHATALRDWLCHAAQAEARVGGRLYAWWNDGYHASGAFTTLEPGAKIVFTWHGRDEPEPTRVRVTLAPSGEATQVNLSHMGVGAGRRWAAAREAIHRRWAEGLENLQSLLETGTDLRVARLPRLGILVGDFNADVARRLRTPVTSGLRLDGTFEATGARAAGLQKDDVLVRLGGKKAVDFPSLSNALKGRAAGDRVRVVFYRGAEKMTVTMELSRRPTPEFPATAEALAEAARRNHAEMDRLLAQWLEDVSEAEAERRPAPGEWSLKELVAHFIATERDLQSWIADMLNDNVVGDSLEFRPNVTPRLAALVARHPTVAALLEELRQSAAETAGLLSALPAEFVARKHMYYRVASWITQVVPSHLTEEHGEQFQATVRAARA